MSITSSGGEVTDALNGKLTFEQSKNRIVGRDENNVARLIILADNDDFSMKVSKDGLDVINATESQLIFNSNNNLFKVVQTGTISHTLPANTSFSQATLPHGLDYTPAIMAFLNVGSGAYIPTPYLQFGATNGLNLEKTEVHVDSTNIYLRLHAPNAGSNPFYSIGYSRSAKYYLFTETAT